MPALVRLDRVTKDYSEGRELRHVLKDASLEVAEGEFVAIRGRSGSGKSTVLNLVAGIDRPSSGEIYVAGNALSLASMRATLGEVLTDAAFERMVGLGERFEHGVQQVIASRELPWHVTRLGCRVEYLFRPDVARNGAQAAAGQDEELDSLIHLYMLNRGILMTPFHNMSLMSPATQSSGLGRFEWSQIPSSPWSLKS